jgi:hypothetical protein
MEIDVTDWAVIRREEEGRDEDKLWLGRSAGSPRVEQWLWKPRPPTGNGTVWQMNDAAEVIASRLAWSLGMPAADCRYAVREGSLGVISRNVTPPSHDLHNASTVLAEIDGYVHHQQEGGGRLRSDEGYTLDAVEHVLDGLSGPPGWEHLRAFELFAGFLVLDAFVANTDRHPQNWAILEDRGTGERALAPTFDHGRALGSGMTDEKRRSADVPVWCARGRANPFTPREGLLHLARRAVEGSAAAWWLTRVKLLDIEHIHEMMSAPPGRLSVDASSFMEQVLIENRRRLCTC